MSDISHQKLEKKFIQTFEDLDVYKSAFERALQLHKISLTFPKIEQYVLADQIRRSSKSVCANIAEGFGKQRGSKADFKRFLLMAIGSSDETRVWIDFARELDYIPQVDALTMKEDFVMLSKKLQSLYSSISDPR